MGCDRTECSGRASYLLWLTCPCEPLVTVAECEQHAMDTRQMTEESVVCVGCFGYVVLVKVKSLTKELAVQHLRELDVLDSPWTIRQEKW